MIFEIFKSGKHTSSNGFTKEYSPADLQAIADNFSEDVPIVVGHPKDNSPAFGWVKKLFVEIKDGAASLFAEAKDLVPEFVDLLKQKVYKNRSVSLSELEDGTFKLNHVGFLGGALPAVKGLAALNLSAADDSYDFILYDVAVDFSAESSPRDAAQTADAVSNEEEETNFDESDKSDISNLPDDVAHAHGVQWTESGGEKHLNISLSEPATPLAEPGGEEKNFSEFIASLRSLKSELEEVKKTLVSQNSERENYSVSNTFAETLAALDEKISDLNLKIDVAFFQKNLIDKLRFENVTPAIEEKIISILGYFKDFNFSDNEHYESVVSDFQELIDLIVPFQSDEFIKKTDNERKFKNEFSDFEVDEDSQKLFSAAQKLSEKENVSFKEAINILINNDNEV